MRDITLSPSLIDSPRIMQVPEGLTVKQTIDAMYESIGMPTGARTYPFIVEVDGEPVTDWSLTPDTGSHVLIYAPLHGGGGGKSPVRTLLTIAVVVAATAVSGGALATQGGWFAAGTMSASLAAAGTLTAGMFLVNALAPIRAPHTAGVGGRQSYEDSPSYSISGARNTETPWGPIPVVLGKHRQFPPLGARQYVEVIGGDEYMTVYVVWGYGRLHVSNIRIGDTAISAFEDVEIETTQGQSGDSPLTLVPSLVFQDQIGVILEYGESPIVRSPKPGADRISVDVSFPRGLMKIDKQGKRKSRSVTVKIEYREIGGAWITEHERTTTDKTASAIRWRRRWNVDRSKQYEVRLSRISGGGDDRTIDDVYWTNLHSIVNDPPCTFPIPLAQTAFRIKATDQLNNVIDSVNADVSSYAPTWNGSAWTGSSLTSNPAALFRLVLMHPANARARVASQINDGDLGDWYDECVTHGYEFNMIRDFRASVWDALADIAAAGRASPSITNGLWTAMMDSGDQPLVQHITPRNSWGFSSEKVLFDKPHAFRIRFINEKDGYRWDERIVYDDGYHAGNATDFEQLEFPGVTNSDNIWKFGRFHIAQARLRPEMYSLYQDFEHLVCRRGTKVRVSHDIPLWGAGWGRVKSLTIDSGNVTHITLDDTVVMEAGTGYACRFRRKDGGTLVLSIVTAPGAATELELQSPVPEASAPEVGDMAMFGEAERETVELLVHSIRRAGDYTAQIFLTDVAEEIYDADTGRIPSFDAQITKPLDVTRIRPDPPSVRDIESGFPALEVRGQTVTARIFLYLEPPRGTVRIGTYLARYRLRDESRWRWVSSDETTVIIPSVQEEEDYEIQVRAESIYGVRSRWSASVFETVIGGTEKPDNVTGFSVNVVGEDAYLSWDANTEPNLAHYRIRWSPNLQGATWASSVDMVRKVAKPATSVTLPALVGTYLIKAATIRGIESETAAAVITNVARIAGLNFIESLSWPAWDGVGDNVFDAGPGLMLASSYDLYGPGMTFLTEEGYYLLVEDGSQLMMDDGPDLYEIEGLYTQDGLEMEGTWTFTEAIDLLGVFTSRVIAEIGTIGADLLKNLYLMEDLYESPNLYGTEEDQFSVIMEIRTTDDDPAGTPEWRAWQSFVVGDYTARAFQFRVRLYGFPPGITPVVQSIYVEVDMPDRTYPFSASIAAGGTSVSFDPAFYTTPELGLSVSDGEEGDKYQITSKSREGFTIAFTNGGNNVARSISGIALGYGATYERSEYQVYYDGNTNTDGNPPVDANDYEFGATVTVLGEGTLEKDDHVFDEWNTESDGSGTSYSQHDTFSMGAANVTLYAQWVEVYSVTYDGNTNTSGNPPTDANKYRANETVTVSGEGTLVKSDYVFDEWNTAANGSGTSYSENDTFNMPASNITLYAQWIEIVAYYPPAHNTTYVKATSVNERDGVPRDECQPWLTTDPNLSLTGGALDNSWLSEDAAQQRFHIDVGSAITLARIYYENYHTSGFQTATGAKTFTFWGSNNAGAFAELTYGTDTNWTQISVSAAEFAAHTSQNVPDPKYMSVGLHAPYRYFAFKIADNHGGGAMGIRHIELQGPDGQ